MKLLGIIETDFVNYKEPAMVLEFPYCTFKCNKEAGKIVCQNFDLQESEITDYEISSILNVYERDDLSQAIVCQGLEPLDSFDDVVELLSEFRKVSNDYFIVYTGYNLDEIEFEIDILKRFGNVIVKVGRYIENNKEIFDSNLGITLASSNQYAINLNTF